MLAPLVVPPSVVVALSIVSVVGMIGRRAAPRVVVAQKPEALRFRNPLPTEARRVMTRPTVFPVINIIANVPTTPVRPDTTPLLHKRIPFVGLRHVAPPTATRVVKQPKRLAIRLRVRRDGWTRRTRRPCPALALLVVHGEPIRASTDTAQKVGARASRSWTYTDVAITAMQISNTWSTPRTRAAIGYRMQMVVPVVCPTNAITKAWRMWRPIPLIAPACGGLGRVQHVTIVLILLIRQSIRMAEHIATPTVTSAPY